VTGVQTCALPILGALGIANRHERVFTDEEIAQLIKVSETLSW